MTSVKVCVLTEDGDGVTVARSLEEIAEKFKPSEIIADSYPRRCLETVYELSGKGVRFFRLADLRSLAEHRRFNGVQKSDENDVKVLREIFRHKPEGFRELRKELIRLIAMTEQWMILNEQRKRVKQASIEEGDEVVKDLKNAVARLSYRIRKAAEEIPLYREIRERLGLEGPSVGYILSHRYDDLLMKPRDKLEVTFELYDRPYKGRKAVSRVLIGLAWSAVRNKHPRYHSIYRHFHEKLQGRHRRWKATLRTAQWLLRDIRKVAKKVREA